MLTDLTVIVGFNDLAIVDRVLREYRGQVAGMILEPIMMNAGIILPEPGYLAGLKELLHAHGGLLAFDEVKTGLTAGPGGVTRLSGVTPDIICLAKAIGGGISVAAVGGSYEVMKHVADGDYEMVGTFSGNPEPVRDFRDFLAIDDQYSHAHWLFQHNGGVFLPPWGKSEQWLISVQHDENDIARFNRNVDRFASSIA